MSRFLPTFNEAEEFDRIVASRTAEMHRQDVPPAVYLSFTLRVDIAIAVETLGREEAAALILGAGLDAGVHLWRAPPPVAPIEARCRRAESAARAWRRAFLALGFVIALAWGLR